MKKKRILIIFNTGLIVGVIMGVLVWNLLLAAKIDNLYKRNKYLESVSEDYRIKLEKLEQSQPEKELTVKDISVQIDIEDVIDRMILEQAIKQKYESLLGKKINEIDIDLVIEVVDKRIFVTDKNQYQITVDRVILSSTLSLSLSAREMTLD